jgi:phage-related protein
MAVPTSELQGISPSSIIELFVLELNALQHGAAATYRFHAGTNLVSNGDVVWASNTYQRFPILVRGFVAATSSAPSRPSC